jgi:hypothetical protein
MPWSPHKVSGRRWPRVSAGLATHSESQCGMRRPRRWQLPGAPGMLQRPMQHENAWSCGDGRCEVGRFLCRLLDLLGVLLGACCLETDGPTIHRRIGPRPPHHSTSNIMQHAAESTLFAVFFFCGLLLLRARQLVIRLQLLSTVWLHRKPGVEKVYLLHALLLLAGHGEAAASPFSALGGGARYHYVVQRLYSSLVCCVMPVHAAMSSTTTTVPQHLLHHGCCAYLPSPLRHICAKHGSFAPWVFVDGLYGGYGRSQHLRVGLAREIILKART